VSKSAGQPPGWLPNLVCAINLRPTLISAAREGGSIFPKGCRVGDRIS